MRVIDCLIFWAAAGLIGAPASLSAEDGSMSGTDKAGRTIISGEPWSPPPASAPADDLTAPKVIYGTDDRIDVYQETDPLRRQLAAATCGLVEAGQLTQTQSGYNLQTSAWRISGLPPCSGEPFANQPVAAFCTGFLVAPDVIVTAGHCYDVGDLSGVRFIFGFEMSNATTPVTALTNDQVYRGIQVLGHQLSGDNDYSVIKLDRPVTAPGAIPLQIRREGAISNGTLIGVIGHPSGLPKKIAFGANTAVSSTSNSFYFTANLDTYGGNSGSPVFNAATGVVEGILVRGATDFENGGSCFRSVRLSDSQAQEESTRATIWAQFVPLAPSQLGTISLNRDVVACGSSITCTVSDAGLQGAASVTVTVTTNGGDSEVLNLTPTSAGSAVFTGTIQTVNGAAQQNSGVLNLQDGEGIVFTYNDANTGSGAPGVATATATADCFLNDYFTQVFDSGMDLDNITLTFTPDGGPNFYSLCATPATGFPTSPAGGTTLTAIGDDGSIQVAVTGGSLSYFGQSYASVFVNSNGFITFDGSVTDFTPSLEDHFNRKQISAAFQDLNPGAGGQVSYRQMSDRLAITWNNVPRYDVPNDVNQIQVELFFNGVIQITHLRVDMDRGVVGVSPGGGVPADYTASDLSAYPGCGSGSLSGAIIGTALPGAMFPGQSFTGTVTVLNTGSSPWFSGGGVSLAASTDSCGIVQPSTIAIPANVTVPQNGTYTFPVTLKAPQAPGYCGIFFVPRSASGPIGSGVVAEVNVQESFNPSFASGAPGWSGGTLLGNATATLESGGGLCLSAPLTGDNIAGWFSPDAYMPLVDLGVIRAQFTLSTDQTNPDAIPLLDLTYDNFYSAGTGPVYGGELVVIDVAGGANGVGRAQGRSSFEIWAAPNSALTPQWRGMVDSASGAFTPAADALNDMRLGYRTLDLDGASVAAWADSGKVCVQSMLAQRYSIPALQTLGNLINTPIHTWSHEAQNTAQSGEPGTAYINDTAGAAIYQLAEDISAGGRKTLFPFQKDIYDPGNPLAYAPFYPIAWASNTIYLGSIFVASFVGGGVGPEGVDPLDVLSVNLDATTSELVNLHFSTRGAPNYFERAASPRLPGTVGGVQRYIGFFYGHNVTGVDLNIVPNANRLRMQGDFINSAQIAPQGVGADSFFVTGMSVDVVSP